MRQHKATRPRATVEAASDENSAPFNRTAPSSRSVRALPGSWFQKFGMSREACVERFRLWTGDMFFFPSFCDLSDVAVEAGWLPEHLLADGTTLPLFSQLAELAAGLLPADSKSNTAGPPPVRLCTDGLEAACSDPPPETAKGCLWRPVFRITYKYCWSPYVAFMAGGGGPVPLVVAVTRPYVYF